MPHHRLTFRTGLVIKATLGILWLRLPYRLPEDVSFTFFYVEIAF
jgi:hypothetical protein